MDKQITPSNQRIWYCDSPPPPSHSKDVDTLKYQLVCHDTFYNGQNLQDSTECLLMLINIIHKGSLPDSNSTTYPMGASLSDILFSFVLEKCLRCMRTGVPPTDASPVQDLILPGLQRRLQRSCSWCDENTWHVGSGYMLRPPRYLLLFVGRFGYIDDDVTRDRCSIPVDHHGPSVHSSHYAASLDCCKKAFCCGGRTVVEFWVIDSKDSSTAYVILYELVDTCFLDSDRRVGVWSPPWRWDILSVPLTTGRGTGAETRGLDDVFPPDDLCSRSEALC